VKSSPSKMTFSDGHALDHQTICLASRMEEDLDNDISRVSIIKNGKWTYSDFNDIAVSVTCLHRDRQVFFLGYNGNIMIGNLPATGRGSRATEVIPVSEELGNFLRIRNIAEKVYVCGMSGQVYRRERNAWQQIDQGIRGEAGLDFEDIGGTADDDLYAVASSGVVCHFNGKQWRKLDFPANRPFSGVKCVAEDEVYVCGNDGNLFRGSRDSWEFIGDESIEENFWAVEKFDDRVYVAYNDGLFVHDGTKLSEVKFGIKGDVDGHRLQAGEGALYSFGEENVLWFDRQTWHRIA
jgi:hypothetical protein